MAKSLKLKNRPPWTDNPQVVGDIIKEMFRSNSPLAKGYRKHIARKEIRAEKGDKV